MKRHLVLTGLPGSGKTTVGRRVAELLGAAFTDLDETVVMATGRSVTEIFAGSGEELFRRLERSAMDGALDAPPHVVAPGAGWIAQPGNLAAAERAGALVAYLRVTPALAAARLAGSATRPLLAGGAPVTLLAALLAERERWYLKGRVVDAEASVEAVAAFLVAQEAAGW